MNALADFLYGSAEDSPDQTAPIGVMHFRLGSPRGGVAPSNSIHPRAQRPSPNNALHNQPAGSSPIAGEPSGNSPTTGVSTRTNGTGKSRGKRSNLNPEASRRMSLLQYHGYLLQSFPPHHHNGTRKGAQLGCLKGDPEKWEQFFEMLHNFASWRVAWCASERSKRKGCKNSLKNKHPHLYKNLQPPGDEDTTHTPPKRGIFTIIMPTQTYFKTETSPRCHVLTIPNSSLVFSLQKIKKLTEETKTFLSVLMELYSYKKTVSSNSSNICILLPPPKSRFAWPDLTNPIDGWQSLPWEFHKANAPMHFPDAVPTVVINMAPAQTLSTESYFREPSWGRTTHPKMGISATRTTQTTVQQEVEHRSKDMTTRKVREELLSSLLRWSLKGHLTLRSPTNPSQRIPKKEFMEAENLLFPPQDDWDAPDEGHLRAAAAYKGVQTFLKAMNMLDAECFFCFGNHPPEICRQFARLTISDRWKCIEDRQKIQQFCVVCFRREHLSKKCPYTPCTVGSCNGPHHELLHRTESSDTETS